MRTEDIRQILIGLLKATDGPETLRLSPGQIISVLVREIQGDMALLQCQGLEITAKLEVDIPPGERLRCLVEGEKDGQIILKVLSETGEKTGEQALRGILKGLGLPADRLNLQVLEEMVKQEMPLLTENICSLAAFARSVGIAQEDLKFAVFLVRQGFILNKEVFQAVKQLFSDMEFLHAGLQKLLAETDALAEKPGQAAGLRQIAAQLKEAVSGMQILNSDGHEVIAAKLGAVFRQFLPDAASAGLSVRSPGFPTVDLPTGSAVVPRGVQGDAVRGNVAGAETGEAGHPAAGTVAPGTAAQGAAAPGTTAQGVVAPGTVAQGAAAPGTVAKGPAAPPVAMPGTTVPDSAGPKNAVLTDAAPGTAGPEAAAPGNPVPGSAVQGTADTAGHPAARAEHPAQHGFMAPDKAQDGMAARIQTVLEQAVAEDSRRLDLRSLVKLLVTALEADAPEHGELVRAANNVLDRLEFIQHLNRAEPGRDNIFVVYSTVRFEERQEPLRLLVSYRYDGKNKRKDFTSCKVEVTLHTPGLGLVRCELQVSSRNLTVQFVADSPAAAGVIDDTAEVLARRLEGLKYRVTMLPSRVQPPEQVLTLADEKPDLHGLFRVNLRV